MSYMGAGICTEIVIVIMFPFFQLHYLNAWLSLLMKETTYHSISLYYGKSAVLACTITVTLAQLDTMT